MFAVIAEVEFSFLVLGMIGDKVSVRYLNMYVEQPVSWDEGNISNAAKYGIEAIES